MAIEELGGISWVEGVTLYERSTIYRKYKRGEFPEPLYIGNRRVWRKAEIERWVADQLARAEADRPGAATLTNTAAKDASTVA